MRIKLLLLAISIVFTSQLVTSQVPSYIPTNGLIAYYPFNGNANDASGNGNNGIIDGATLINDRFGNLNGAYNFNGQGQNIKVTTINNSSFENDFTISMWCKFSDFLNDYEHLIYGENQFIVLNGNGPAYNSSLSKVSGYQGPYDNISLRRTPYLESLSHLTTDTYSHIIYKKNDNVVSIYINGNLESTITTNNSLALPSGNYIEFGSGFTGTTNYSFNGVIDDIGIWNRALSEQEIQGIETSNPNLTNSQCWLNISAGSFHNLAIKSDNTLWTWGFNQYGQLGDNTILDKTLPIQIGTDTNWSKISAGLIHSLSVKSNGTLWAWGDNSYGQLGDGTNSNKIYPIQIGSSNQWKTISSNFYSSYAIKTDGTLWAWGDNSYGQLGDGTNINKSSPIQVNNSTDWKSISAGVNHASAIKNDGSLWAWGWNQWHQLGNGGTNDSNIPIQIGTDNNWKSVTCGNGYTIAIKTDGTIWSWGYNAVGECGYLVNTINNIPHQIGTDSDWKDVNTCYRHTIAIKTNGSLYAWGFNQHGQLGDNTTNDANHPILIGTDIDWQSISIGNSSSFSIKTNNSLWSWGNNQTGQLGDGSIIDKTSPIQINCNLLSNNYFTNLYTDLINIYPNPTNSKINIDCGNESKLIGSQIKITNTLGQEIYHSILNRPIYEIPLGSIATNGLYFVSIIDNDGKIITTKKIILQ